MKARKILLWIVAFPAVLYAIAYAALFRTTLPIEGVVVDARTGKPVSKALVHANWRFSYSNLVDTTGGGFGHGTVTGEDGRFRIPRKNVTVVFGRFEDQSLIVKHPLYEFLDQQVYVEMYREYRAGKVEDAEVELTLPISLLEDKYSTPEDNKKLQWVLGNCGPDFYVSMRDQFGVRYDIQSIMKHMEYLATRFPEEGSNASALPLAFTEYKYRMSKFIANY